MADDKLPVKSSDKALAKARRNGRIRGWAEGGGAVVATGLVIWFTKYVLIAAVIGAVGFAGFKYMTRSKGGANKDAKDKPNTQPKALPKDEGLGDLGDLDDGGDVDINDPELAALERELAAMRSE